MCPNHHQAAASGLSPPDPPHFPPGGRRAPARPQLCSRLSRNWVSSSRLGKGLHAALEGLPAIITQPSSQLCSGCYYYPTLQTRSWGRRS